MDRENIKDYGYFIVCMLKSILIWIALVFSICADNTEYNVLLQRIYDYARTNILLSNLLIYLIFNICWRRRHFEKRQEIFLCLLAIVFTLMAFIGLFFEKNLVILFENEKAGFLIILVLLGVFFAFENIIPLFWVKFDSISKVELRGRINKIIFDINPVWRTMLVILLCWFPYYIVTYPGGVQWDALSQLNQYYGIQPLTNHHPVFSTWFMGSFLNIGRIIWNDNLGVFLYNIFQSIVLAYSFGLFFKVMSFLKTPYEVRWLCLLAYSLIAIWPSYAQLMIKDTLYVAIFAIFVYQLVWYILLNNNIPYANLKLGIIALLLCLLRNNGFYVVLLTFLTLVIMRRDVIRKSAVVIISMLVYMCVIKAVFPYYGIEGGSRAEMLSLPFQQTARYVLNYGADIPENEKQAIDKVLDYESLRNIYNPEIADPVKGTYKQNVSEADFRRYLSVWWKQFLNHPVTYIMSSLNGTYGYYSLDAEIKGKDDPYRIEDNPSINTGYFDIHYTSPLAEKGIKVLREFSYFEMSIPIVGLLYNLGFYTWINIFLGAKLKYLNKGRDIVALIPSFVTVLICIASPVNTYIRYMLPVLAVTPLSIAFVLSKVSEQTTKEI